MTRMHHTEMTLYPPFQCTPVNKRSITRPQNGFSPSWIVHSDLACCQSEEGGCLALTKP